MKLRKNLLLHTFVLTMILAAPALAECEFNTSGTTMYLTADCNTETTIVIPDGYTLDFNGNTITAVDPAGGSFLGAVVKNGGAVAHVLDASITTMNLTVACHGATPVDNRLRGILFNGASGSITGGSVMNINQGASGCQEGNGIEIRNPPFDGNTPGGRKEVTITNVDVSNYQKTGILMNGNIQVTLTNSKIGTSATQANLAANAVQVGYGALAYVERNKIGQNSWLGASDWVATGALLYLAAPGTVFSQNIMMDGNADVGIYIYSNGITVENNKVFETGDDATHGDWGIGNWGTGNIVGNNKIKGYETAIDGDESRRNVVIPSPKD
jgi:hypothetical protein